MPPFLFLHTLPLTVSPFTRANPIYIVCSIKHAPYIIYDEFYLGTCTEKFDEGHSTAYLISRIRCNNIHIRILLHLILEIRYAVPYPFGPDVDVNTKSIKSPTPKHLEYFGYMFST